VRRLLFVCSQNRLRSPTAEAVFSKRPGVEAASAGLNEDASTPVSGALLEWADVVFVMERAHRNRLARKFGPQIRDKRVVVLGIPDDYEYMDADLVRLLEARVGPWLRRPPP